jgi:hypothetical protein
MNTGADWRLDSPSLRPSLPTVIPEVSQTEAIIDLADPIDLTVAPNSTPAGPVPRGFGSSTKEVSPMYSPVSFAFFGLTGTAVGAAGLTGSFGGLTSLVITATILAIMFSLLLAARFVARRRAVRSGDVGNRGQVVRAPHLRSN